MIEVFEISGMTCQHCVARVQKALASNPRVEQVSVTLQPPIATITLKEPVQKEELQESLNKAGGYKIVQQ